MIVTVVDGPGAVREQRARPDRAPIVSEGAETIVFADGQIVTSRLDEVGEHLGRLGWIDREIVISSPYQRRGGAARRRRG